MKGKQNNYGNINKCKFNEHATKGQFTKGELVNPSNFEMNWFNAFTENERFTEDELSESLQPAVTGKAFKGVINAIIIQGILLVAAYGLWAFFT